MTISHNRPIGFDPACANRAVNNGNITANEIDIDTTKLYLVRYDRGSKVASGMEYKGTFTDLFGQYGAKGKKYLNFYSIEHNGILLDLDDGKNCYVTDDQNIIEPSIDWITYTFKVTRLEDVTRELDALAHLFKCKWVMRKSGGRLYAQAFVSTGIGAKDSCIIVSFSLPEAKEGTKNLRGTGKVEISGKPLGALTIGQQRIFLQYLKRREHFVTRIDTKGRVYGNTPTPYEIWEQIDHELHDRPKQLSRFTGLKLITDKGYSSVYGGCRQNVLYRIYQAFPLHKVDAVDHEVEWHNHKTKDRVYNYAHDLAMELANTANTEGFSQLILTKVFGVCNFYNATGESDGHMHRYPIREWQVSLRVQSKCKEFVRYRPTKRGDIHKRRAGWLTTILGKSMVTLGLYAQDTTAKETMALLANKRHTVRTMLDRIKLSIDPFIDGILLDGLRDLCEDFKNPHFKLLDAELELLRSLGKKPSLSPV